MNRSFGKAYKLPRHFTPLSISGLVLWLDASYITGFNDGDSVTTWSDLSGNGNDATQATASKRPVYKVNIINGRPVVRFDGTDDFMAAPTGARPPTSYTVFIVAAINNLVPATYYRLIATLDSGGNVGLALMRQGDNNTWRHTWGTGVTTSDVEGGTVVVSVFDIVIGTHNGTTSSLFENGSSVGTPISSAYSQGTNDVEVGSTSGGTIGFLNGDIAAIGIYTSSLSTTDRQRIERYLGSRYGITVS